MRHHAQVQHAHPIAAASIAAIAVGFFMSPSFIMYTVRSSSRILHAHAFPWTVRRSHWRLRTVAGKSIFETSITGGVGQASKTLSHVGRKGKNLSSTPRDNDGMDWTHTTNVNEQRISVSDSFGSKESLTMDKLYSEWTVEDDKMLYNNRHQSAVKLASLLGRGLHGVEARLRKITNVDSTAYARCFGVDEKKNLVSEPGLIGVLNDKTGKLTPVKEVLRRIQWDPTLPSSSFFVIYYDRVEENLCETNFDASNDSISGKAERFVFALPEHRIQQVKYLERVVWDKDMRLDFVFGSMNGQGVTIDQVIASYDEWKQQKDAKEKKNRQRQEEITKEMSQFLDEVKVGELNVILSQMQTNNQRVLEVKEALNAIITLYYDSERSQNDINYENENLDDPVIKTENESFKPIVSFLYLFSELVVLLPNEQYREALLIELERSISKFSRDAATANEHLYVKRPNHLPELKEDELDEKFVRGSGAGGQKINKTAIKVVLVHSPTQIRVECQDTRSLQQNRKIARRRLQLKLDDFVNGHASRNNQKAIKAIAKKSKNQARNKRRLQQKKNKTNENFPSDVSNASLILE